MGRVYLPGRGRRAVRLRAATCRARRTRWPRSSASRTTRAADVVRARASSCCRCSTGAAARAWPPWPASTGGSSCASTPTRRPVLRRPAVAADTGEAVGRGPQPARSSVRPGVTAPRRRRRRRAGRAGRRARPAPTAATEVDAARAAAAPRAAPRRRSERHGLWFDNGQHVFLRCCTAYRAFLDRIGATDLCRPPGPPRRARRSRPAGARRGWPAAPLPAPLHLGPALARLPAPRPPRRGCRLGAGRAGAAAPRPRRPALDAVHVRRLAGRRTASGRTAIDRALEPHRPADAQRRPSTRPRSALAAKVFRTGLLDRADAADIGWARVPLSASCTASRRRARAPHAASGCAPTSRVDRIDGWVPATASRR